MVLSIIKIFLPTVLAFAIGIALTPRLAGWMYRKRLWKSKSRNTATDITSDEFKKIHNEHAEVSTPRVGGIIIWLSVVATIALMWIVSKAVPSSISEKLDFYSRSQTLVPLAALLLGAGIGLIDDFLQIKGTGKYAGDAISYRKIKIISVIAIGIIIGAWFYFKLGMTAVAIPFTASTLPLGVLFIPFFIVVLLAVFSGSVIDGMDGLAGGVLAIIFAAYAAIAVGIFGACGHSVTDEQRKE